MLKLTTISSMTQISLRKSVPGCHAMTWVRSPRRGWIQVSWHLLAFVTPKTKGFSWQNSWMRMILLRIAISNCWSTIDPLWGHYEHWAPNKKLRLLDPEAHLRRPELRKWRSRRRRQHVGCGRQGRDGRRWPMVSHGGGYPNWDGMVTHESLYVIVVAAEVWFDLALLFHVVSFFAKLRTIAEHSWAINCTSGTMFLLTS